MTERDPTAGDHNVHTTSHILTLACADRPGIVHAVSARSRKVDVEELTGAVERLLR